MIDGIEISLETLMGGKAIEKFNGELQKVIENILDLETDGTKNREIHLVFKMKPDPSDRGRVFYSLDTKTKLAPPVSIGSTMFLGNDRGRVKAYEQDVNQPPLFDEQKKSNVTFLREDN